MSKNDYDIGARVTDPKGCVKEPQRMRDLEKKINEVMTRMFQRPENGGNPFLYSIAMSKPHEVHDELGGMKGWKTAATDGKRFFWHPEFLEKLDTWEATTVMSHEVFHDLFFHVDRGMGRQYPRIWNWAIDYVVNGIIWDDHEKTKRGEKIGKTSPFGGNLGNPLSLKDLLGYLAAKQELPDGTMIFADKTLYERSPDSIYDEIVKAYENSPRRCGSCGQLTKGGKKPKKGGQKGQKGKGGQKGQQGEDGQDQGQGGSGGDQDGDQDGQGGQGQDGQQGQQPGGQGGHQHDPNAEHECECPECGADTDGLDSLDSHMPSKSSKDDVQADMMRAAMRCKSMGIGSVPGSVEDALADLMKPQLKFRDIVRNCMVRKSQDSGLKNDWSRCRKRYLAARPSQYLPKRYSHRPRWIAMIDTSGSMGDDDIAYGISQLQVLGPNTDGFIVPCDTEVNWDKITKVTSKTDLKRTKIVGRGGTAFDNFFREFPKRLGTDFDVVVILTDGDCPIPPKDLRPPCDVVWVITNGRHKGFKPAFGRVAPLRNERI